MKRWSAALFAAACCFVVVPVSAQQDTSQLAQLRRQLEALTRDVEALRLGEDVAARADTTGYGFGPAASKVYRTRAGVSIGGYGEVLYENFASKRQDDAQSNARDQVDALRLIAYIGYKFTPTLLFNSEIEFEHGATGNGGTVSVEFSYLDWLASERIGVRAGMLLVPMGLINELHEPPVFLGARRPLTEQSIIPSTWRENGFGVFGEVAGFSYRAYLINGLDAIGGRNNGTSGFSAGGIRSGRQNGAFALAENPALVARLDYTGVAGLLVGGSAYTGNSGQGAKTGTGQEIDAATRILEGHAQYRARGFDLRGLFATASIDDADLINTAKRFTGAQSVAESMRGWYVQGGFDVLRSTTQELMPYVRYEWLNTQDRVPTGFTAAPANERTVTTLGAMWKPIVNVALKADYQIISNKADTGVNQFNLALGYLF